MIAATSGPSLAFERFGIDMAVGLGRHFVHREAGKGGGGGIGAMGRFRHQDARARFAARRDGGADRQQPAQFAMRARLGRHRHRRHAGQRGQPVHQFGDQLQRALRGRLRRQRMQIAEARQPRHLLVQARIVLHGAGAQRIKPASMA